MSQAGPQVVRADTRQRAEAFWSVSTFLLNGALFVLIGLEVQAAILGLTSLDLARGMLTVAAVSVVIIAVRFGWLFGITYLIRLLDRRPQQRLRRVSNRARVVSGVAGFRGAVSLAAALAVPMLLASVQPFRGRETIIFVTAGVIVISMLQGLLLPSVVRWAHLPADTSMEDERNLAEALATEEALAALPQLAAELDTDPEVAERLCREYEEHLRILHVGRGTPDDEPTLRHDQHYTALRLALLDRKRATVVRLRDERRIDDIVLRQVQTRLDIEEVRLVRHEAIE